MRVRSRRTPLGAFSRWPAAAFVAAALTALLFSATTCARRPLAGAKLIDSLETREPLLRVRIARGVSAVEIDSDAPLRLRSVSPTDPRPTSVATTPARFRLAPAGYVVGDDAGSRRTLPFQDRLLVIGEGDIRIDGVRHRGRVSLHRAGEADDGTFDVVVEIAMEDYLAGVVSSELYAGWGDAAHEAQAIAARSYAMHERERRRSRGDHFDLENTTRDQAYNGADATADALRAVKQTRGLVLTHPGGTLRAYYSSTCGGRPASAADVWPTSHGYEYNLATPLQAVPRDCPCDFSPRYRWSIERSRDDLSRRLAAFGAARGRPLQNLKSASLVTPSERNAAGRPAIYTVYDRSGEWWELSAEDLRLALNFADARRGLARPPTDRAAWSGDVDVDIHQTSATVRGRGFGHGVGMCQFGAEGLDRRGEDAFEILAFYYPGAQVRRLY